MKHLIYSCRFALLMILLTATLTSNAEQVNGINYELWISGYGDNAVADSAIVTGPASFAGALDIPSSITVPYTYTKFIGYDENDNPKYITVTRDLTYPVTAINDCAFSALGYENRNHITSVTIPNTVTRIGHEAFYCCTNISGTVTIPSSVNNVELAAFAFCTGITQAIINNSIIGESEFLCCTGLTNVIMSNSVTTIGYEAFIGCTGLTGQLILPNSLRKISDGAFEGCTGLTGHLYIPNSVTTIGEYGYRYGAFENCAGLTGVTLSNSLTNIGYRSFGGCTGLTGQLDIPNSVTTIGEGAFQNCTGLTGVNLGNSLTTIGYRAFYQCYNLTNLTIPENVNLIGKEAFHSTNIKTLIYNAKRCTSSSYISKTNIEQLTIGNEVEYLPYDFMFGSKIKEVTIPESLDTIGQKAFAYCNSLKTVYWNARNCTTKYKKIYNDDDSYWYDRLGSAPFADNRNLSHIVIGKNVESIDDETFYNTLIETPLDTVTCQSVVPSAITAACFNTENTESVYWPNNVYEKTVLCVPKGSLQAYQEAEGWKEFNHIVEMDDALQGDADGDGAVSIADVVVIIDFLLNSDAISLNLTNADADNDGTISIADIVAIIDYLLAHHW